ncbi:MAG: chemotaxis protein CheB, partial [Bacteroidota bacterium]
MADVRPFVIAIGTSAGGLETLTKLFDGLPKTPNLAIVVLQHLSPDHKSLMGELLARHSSMPIVSIEDQQKIEGGMIYLLPPKYLLGVEKGVFQLEKRLAGNVVQFPIDRFFEQLAADQPDRAVAIILSGTGTDGTRGIKVIKEKGGTVIVQDPKEAKFDGMPNSAISTQLADLILEVAQIQSV